MHPQAHSKEQMRLLLSVRRLPSGAHTPDQHLSDRQVCVDGRLAHTSAHGNDGTSHLKDICVWFPGWHSRGNHSYYHLQSLCSWFPQAWPGALKTVALNTHPAALTAPQMHSPPHVRLHLPQDHKYRHTGKGLSANTRVVYFHSDEQSFTAFQT